MDGSEMVNKSTATDQAIEAAIDFELEDCEILCESQGPLDRFGLGVRVQERLDPIDPALINVQVLAATPDRRHADS
jgi:hypothetical protein